MIVGMQDTLVKRDAGMEQIDTQAIRAQRFTRAGVLCDDCDVNAFAIGYESLVMMYAQFCLVKEITIGIEESPLLQCLKIDNSLVKIVKQHKKFSTEAGHSHK